MKTKKQTMNFEFMLVFTLIPFYYCKNIYSALLVKARSSIRPISRSRGPEIPLVCSIALRRPSFVVWTQVAGNFKSITLK